MEDAPPLHPREAGRNAALERLRRQYYRDLNPLYVWQAVGLCNLADYPPRPLPRWCMTYLTTVAVRLTALGRLNDPRSYPFQQPGETGDAQADRQAAWRAQRMPPAAAIGVVPWALGLTRRGWNAFARFDAEQQHDFEAALYEGSDREQRRAVLARVGKRQSISDLAARRVIRRASQRRTALPLPPDGVLPE